LRLKGQTINDETPIFDSERRLENNALTSDFARVMIANLIKSSGMKRTKVSKFRYDKSVIYMFRKRFNTILKLNNEVNSNIAEKLMAHKRGLDGTYLQPTMEECFAEFVKAIPDLTIDPTNRQQLKITEQKEKITELEEKNQRIDELVKAQKNTTKTLDDMMNTLGIRTEGKMFNKEDIEQYKSIISLKMDLDPEYVQAWKEFLKQRTDLPEELTKRISKL